MRSQRSSREESSTKVVCADGGLATSMRIARLTEHEHAESSSPACTPAPLARTVLPLLAHTADGDGACRAINLSSHLFDQGQLSNWRGFRRALDNREFYPPRNRPLFSFGASPYICVRFCRADAG